MSMTLVPNNDGQGLPINNSPPDYTNIPPKLREWIEQFPYEIVSENFKNKFHYTFRCGESGQSNSDDPELKLFRRLRIVVDLMPFN